MLLGTFNPTADAAENVQYGGTLTYLDQVPGLDPMSWDIMDWVWKEDAYEPAFNTRSGGWVIWKGPRGGNVKRETKARSARYCPEEVSCLEMGSEKPMKIILCLRKGIYWQDKPGVMKTRELTADDVVYSLNRLKNARKAIPDYMDFVGKMETPDKYTVIINMTEWAIDWPYRIGWGSYGAIQAPEQEKAPGGPAKWENACATGPYMITNYKQGHSQIYTKNPKYWDSELIGGKKYKLPFTDKVVMMIIKDEATQLASLRTGKIDLMMVMNMKHVDELKKNLPELQWARYLYPGNYSMAMRMDTKPFNDIRVRRALNLAINKKEIIDSFFNGTQRFTPIPSRPPSKKFIPLWRNYHRRPGNCTLTIRKRPKSSWPRPATPMDFLSRPRYPMEVKLDSTWRPWWYPIWPKSA